MASDAGPVRGATLGGYEILFELKAGGMGQVLLARRRGPSGFERLVAIKTMRSELRGRDELRRMFLDEAQLLARLSHPGIAHIHDFGEDRGDLYLAMEYVAGVRFRDLVEAAPLPPEVAARAMADVCRALHAAHELTDLAGHPLAVVHRDVSPDNLMLTFDGQVKVLDFGIALMRGRQAPVTEYGTIKGKPPYLSPEQIKNHAVDRRTDVFAASAVLHELLTGAQLFGGDSLYAIARAIEHDEVARPSRAVGPLPDGLDDAVMRGLDRDPDRRWQSADELVRALDRVAPAGAGESLAAYAARHLGDEARRHREWLRSVLAPVEDAAPPRTGRASGVMTARGPAMAEVLDPDGETFPGDQSAPRRGEPARRRRGRAWIAAAALGGVGAALGGIGWWQKQQARPPAAAARAEGREPGEGPRSAADPGEGAARMTGSAGSALDPAGGTIAGRPTPADPIEPASSGDGTGAPGTTPSAPAGMTASAPTGTTPSAPTGTTPSAPGGPIESTPGRPASRRRADRRGSAPRAARAPRAPSRDRSPTAPEPALTEPIGAGTITVVTRAGAPWAKVFIDGEYVDDTPLMKRSIPAGDHIVVLRDAATRQERDRRRVHVGDGQHVEVVER